MHFAPYDQTRGGEILCFFYKKIHTWPNCFMFGHKINLKHLGVIYNPFTLMMCLVMGVIQGISISQKKFLYL
jgi:hypothetical protein